MTATARRAKSPAPKPLKARPISRVSRPKAAPQKGFSEKVSVTVNSEELAWVRAFAHERFDGNVSAAFNEAVRVLRQQRAREDLLGLFGDAKNVSSEEEAAIVAEWG